MRLASMVVVVLGCLVGATTGPSMVTGSAVALELQPCDEYAASDRAACGSLSVLEDRTDPQGRRIDLNIVVLRAAQPDGRAPLFLLAGGPGQGATDLAGLAQGPYVAVRQHRDVVLVDQRGTGKSNRLDCARDLMSDPQAAFGQLFDPQLVAECREAAAEHADPTLYATPQVVADLEEVRRALGYDKVVLWGGSGGTRTALIWLREHPDVVEAVALDGVAPPSMLAPSEYARGSQNALDRVFEDCEAQESCRDAFPNLRQEFEHILSLFDAGPVQTHIRKDGNEIPVNMHRGDFGYAVRGILYRSGGVARLPQLIHQAAATDDVSAFAELFWQRSVGLGPFVAFGVHFSVFATEDVPFIDAASIPDLTRDTFIGTYLIDQYTAACEAWRGQGTVPEGYHDPVQSNAPVLIVSGFYDPSTPPAYGERVAATLSNSRHIVVRNEAHGAGFGCARDAVSAFLVSGSLEGLGDVCDDVGPVVFETP